MTILDHMIPCYNTNRWAGWLYPIAATCLLLFLPTTALRAEKLIVPSILEYNTWTPEAQRRFDWALGGINTRAMIQAGELVPGATIDTGLPPIAMTVALYRWTEMWANAQRQSSVDYQELLQWRRFTEAVEDCDKWLEHQRRFGFGPAVPIYPVVIDAGVPFFDTYTPEPILDPLTPTFTVTRPWLWGRE